MNFLAHFQLAWPEEGLIAGALEGDYHKGLLRGDLPDALERGIGLHRAIDGFTDRHPVVSELRLELPPHLRRYAGILIDLSFDHFLCLHWHTFTSMPRADFNSEVYRTLQSQQHNLSTNARHMLDRLVQYDILGRYAYWDTVSATAERIGERFTRQNPFIGVEPVLEPLRPSIESAFLAFYPDLQVFSAEHVSALHR
jgi:acyl carrier protein phosphodiesterase